jgi:hypothetical protein
MRSNKYPDMMYTAEHIGSALSVDRLGGICFFSICGAGETMMVDELSAIVYNILKQGHYVNITTNGTITKKFEQFKSFPKEYLSRIHFSFSLHYIELLRINNIHVVFNNIKLIKSLGCSYFTQVNLYDDYNPYLDEIKAICLQEINEIPQLVVTRKNNDKMFSLYTNGTKESYIKTAGSFNSPLFDFTMKNFMTKRKEFCYAGDWSGVLNLSNGQLRQCYASPRFINIFENLSKPLKFEAIGSCRSLYCTNSSHFLSLGCIPALETSSYGSLRNRGGYTKTMQNFLDGKLIDNNKVYSNKKKLLIKYKVLFSDFLSRCIHKIQKLLGDPVMNRKVNTPLTLPPPQKIWKHNSNIRGSVYKVVSRGMENDAA